MTFKEVHIGTTTINFACLTSTTYTDTQTDVTENITTTTFMGGHKFTKDLCQCKYNSSHSIHQ